MKNHSLLRIAAVLALAGGAVVALGQQTSQPAAEALQIAQLTSKGKLQKPADLDSWVFLGTSLGMGYNPGSFNADHPGQFQVVLMEPNAYRHFVKNRQLCAGLDVPAVVLRQRQAEALDQPERLHPGGSHQLRDPRDRPATGDKADRGSCVLCLRTRRTREGVRCRRATTACAATSITAPSGNVRAVLSDAAPDDSEGSAGARRAGPRHPLRRTIPQDERVLIRWIVRCRPTWPRAKPRSSSSISSTRSSACPGHGGGRRSSARSAWLGAISFGVSHGLMFEMSRKPHAFVASVSGLVLVGAGPMLAALFRHAGGRAR